MLVFSVVMQGKEAGKVVKEVKIKGSARRNIRKSTNPPIQDRISSCAGKGRKFG